MARDLIYNGTYSGGRLGGNKYGTFWSAVKPPLPKSAQELVTNTGFEVDTSGWAGFGGYTIARGTSQWHSGVASLEMVNAFGGSSGAYAKYAITLISGGKYRISFWARANSGTPTLGVVNDTASPVTFTISTTWQYFTFVFTSTLTNGGIGFYITINGTFQIDDVSLTYMDDLSSYTLDQSWAERLAENTGRVRGLSSFGTVPYGGTYQTFFPTSYFTFTPMVDLLLIQNNVISNNVSQLKISEMGTLGFKVTWIDNFKAIALFSWHAYGV